MTDDTLSGKGVSLEQCSAGDQRKEGGGNNPYHHGDGVTAAMSSKEANQSTECRGPRALVWTLSSSSGLLGTITPNTNFPGIPGSRQEGWSYIGSTPVTRCLVYSQSLVSWSVAS